MGDYRFGDIGRMSGEEELAAMRRYWADAGRLDPAAAAATPDWLKPAARFSDAIGDGVMGGLAGIGGVAHKAIGYAGDVVDAGERGIRDAFGLQQRAMPGVAGQQFAGDVGEMFNNAGINPEGRMIAGIVDAAGASGQTARMGDMARTMAGDFVADAAGAVGKKGPANMRQVPNIRNMPVDEAVALARREPHLIPSGAGSEGAYVGGPRSIQTRRQLTKMRNNLDDYVAADPRGMDWYDRYRAGVNEVTGSNPRDAEWMSNLEGQYSAGVSPEGELGFAIKDNNSVIATGHPGKPARPAQANASVRALNANDPMRFQLGAKTGEYARRINPYKNPVETATGVNDFRHARNLGFTEKNGEAQRNAIGSASHRWADYETALAVDRANRAAVGGHTNWTGERFQAAPWVRQKALDTLASSHKHYTSVAKQQFKREGIANPTPEAMAGRTYELAFQDANRTIADFFDKHTAFATHEAQPYAAGGHLPGLADAPEAERLAFAADPRSSWAVAPGGRDGIYAGMRAGDTGYAMRVRPTQSMQGVYEGPAGMEWNMGEVARPLVAFDTAPKAAKGEAKMPNVKSLPEADRALLDAGEAVRGYVGYQGATPWHKTWVGGQGTASPDVAVSAPGGPLSREGLMMARAIGQKYGLPDVIDTGQGVTMTNFGLIGPRRGLSPKAVNSLNEDLYSALGRPVEAARAKTDFGYPGYEGTWEAGQGSGAATRQMLDYTDAAPAATQAALDQNPYIPEVARNMLERDAEMAARYGGAREDVQNARRIIAEAGPGWREALRAALARGDVALPAVLLGALGIQGDGQRP